MRKLFSILLIAALLAPTVGSAQGPLAQFETVPLVELRTYGTDTYSGCVTLGMGDKPLGPWRVGPDYVETPDTSDATVDAMDATLNIFTNLAVGDSLWFKREELEYPYRTLGTKTSADSIEVLGGEINLDTATAALGVKTEGYAWFWRQLSCGTAATSGWVPVRSWTGGNFFVIASAESSATGGLDYKLECRFGLADTSAILVTSGNITQATIAAAPTGVVLGNFDFATYGYDSCRAMVKVPAGTVTYSAYVSYRE